MQELIPEGTWGKQTSVKGVTTILGDTLEKKGLQLWPLGLALKELFGYYDFEPEPGKKLAGFSLKNKPTLLDAEGYLLQPSPHGLLPLVQSAAKAWTRKQKTGSDVGSFTHAAIQHYTEGNKFDFSLQGYLARTEEPSEEAAAEFEMAAKAFGQFTIWWQRVQPKLIVAEALVYSRDFKYAGAFDGLLTIDGKTVLADWKTSNASVSAGAPQGVYYSYFIQSALYAIAWEEMGNDPIDDLMIVSCRKDGQFDTVRASELGLDMPMLKSWATAVVTCYKLMDRTKQALMNNVKEKVNV